MGNRIVATRVPALTSMVLASAAGGAALALAGSEHARSVLAGAAIAGLVTAPPLWLPTGVVLGAASYLSGR